MIYRSAGFFDQIMNFEIVITYLFFENCNYLLIHLKRSQNFLSLRSSIKYRNSTNYILFKTSFHIQFKYLLIRFDNVI